MGAAEALSGLAQGKPTSAMRQLNSTRCGFSSKFYALELDLC